MDRNARKAALAALLIFLAFALGAYYMPAIMLALGEWSPAFGGLVAVLFVAAFFGLFYWRARRQRNSGRD